MIKKRKIVIGLILAFGLFVNISEISNTNSTQSVTSIHLFTTSEDKGPIGGNH